MFFQKPLCSQVFLFIMKNNKEQKYLISYFPIKSCVIFIFNVIKSYLFISNISNKIHRLYDGIKNKLLPFALFSRRLNSNI